MSNANDLYQNILANPADDESRLVYADYLEERGDPRAEIIRLQCDLAKMSPFDDRWSECITRERRLFCKHGAEWVPAHGQIMDRGFISQLNQYQPAEIDVWGPEIFAQHPIDFIWFYYQEEEGWGKTFADCEFLHRLRTIWIGGRDRVV